MSCGLMFYQNQGMTNGRNVVMLSSLTLKKAAALPFDSHQTSSPTKQTDRKNFLNSKFVSYSV